MPPDPDAIREVMTRAARLEREWQGQDPGTDPRFLPWMPYSIPGFIALVAEALPAAPGNHFLDIGCGVGTKMLLAREIFGLNVTGVEASYEYAKQAVGLGLHVLMGDAADFGNYNGYGLIWFFRPIGDPALQAALEKTVWDRMSPGCVAIGAGLETRPPDWHVILDDWEVRRGIWLKPPVKP